MMKDYQIDQLNEMGKWSDEDSIMAAYEGWCITNTSVDNAIIAIATIFSSSLSILY